jgi:RES domain-containing protein
MASRSSDSRRAPFKELAFRACAPTDTDFARTAESTREELGRFNTKAVGALYLSLEPETAIEELRRTTERDGTSLLDADPCSILVVDLALDHVVDLTAAESLQAWRLTTSDLEDDDMRCCQEAAERIIHAGAEGVLWPSATGRGRSLAVFVARLGEESHATLVRTHDVSCEALRAIEAGASVSELLKIARD